MCICEYKDALLLCNNERQSSQKYQKNQTINLYKKKKDYIKDA